MSALARWCRAHPGSANTASHLLAVLFGLMSGAIIGASVLAWWMLGGHS